MQVEDGGAVCKGRQDYANNVKTQETREPGRERSPRAAQNGKGPEAEHYEKEEVELIGKRRVVENEVIGPELFEKRDIVEI
jgi:hypothetical protein